MNVSRNTALFDTGEKMEYNKELIKGLVVRKHNALTDGYVPKAGKEIIPDKLINALFLKYQNEGTIFEVTMAELRALLGLKSTKDDHRIYKALEVLGTAVQVRDFSYKGKEVEWATVAFCKARKWKEKENHIEIVIDDMMIEVLKQKVGYTPLEIDICNRFRTKYGLKLYEMFRRYETLPNHEARGVGTVAKSMDELNKMFGTHFTHPSKMKEGIDRGLKEIEKHTGILVTAFWDRRKKKFVFSWAQREEYPKLRIPLRRVEELIDWYIEHYKPKIKSLKKYRDALKKKIIEDEFEELDEYYGGLMREKYGIELPMAILYNPKTNTWKDVDDLPRKKLQQIKNHELDLFWDLTDNHG